MTYDATFPQSQIAPKMSPTQIRTNFSVFGTAETANHVAMNTVGKDQGKHTNVIFKQQTVDPTVTNNYGTLYCKNVVQASGDDLNLFYRIIPFFPNVPNVPQQVTFNVVTLTGYTGGALPAPLYTNAQQSFVFGGLIVYFGKVQVTLTANKGQFSVAPVGSGIPTTSKLISGRLIENYMGPAHSSYSFDLADTGPLVNVYANIGVSFLSFSYFMIGTV